MSAKDPGENLQESPGKTPRPEMMKFRSQRNSVRMPADRGRRQGAIVALALQAFGGKDAAMAFLNGDDVELGARPIDRAMESDEDFAAVAARIAAAT